MRGRRIIFAVVLLLITPAYIYSSSAESCKAHLAKLSSEERYQLGDRKILKNGDYSKFRYTSAKEWKRLRRILVERSLKSNPRLKTKLTAYTPGETLKLMREKEIRDWHKKVSTWKVPADTEWIVFVPCAKTKPWDTATAGLYGSYNQIRNLRDENKTKKIYFVTISEPLGIVPEKFWGKFPQYDNPGLFWDDAMRSGLLTSEWPEIGFLEKRIVPFDSTAYRQAIEKLSAVIANFIQNNSDKKFISFVEDFDGVSTHSDMLSAAEKILGLSIDLARRFTKRRTPRELPKDFILEVLENRI